MRWSWKLGEVAGIGIYMHATFLLLIGGMGFWYWREQGSLSAAAEGVILILALFGCVVLHELGHALTAKKYGIKTRDITLLPIGGLARLERMPDDPRQELWVALAGPAVNVAIAALLFVLLLITNSLVPVERLTVGSGFFLERLMIVNIFLVVFNMLPAFPMDGGRVVRALLATQIEYSRATQIAASLGQAMALLFGFIGFFSIPPQPLLVLIALFVWIGAAEEANMVQVRTALSGVPVSQAMVTDFHTLSPLDPLARVIDLMLSGSQQDFPVMQADALVGLLPRSQTMAALARGGAAITVGEVMQAQFEIADAAEPLEKAFTRLQQNQGSTLPVTREGQLVGLLTAENVGEFLMIRSALAQRS